ncbi:MAG TPA: matrixin family metalloprotease, partial [Gemmatimonadales bacterium]|nr:matrixin family metalloprotease [Gemmatimonadales bacterium]
GTDIFVSAPDHTKLWTPIRVYVIPKYALDDPLTPDCLARVSIHELGHALGLFRHSPDPHDIMYTFPDTAVHAPSEGDATTILTLYHQHSDLRPRPATDTVPPAPAPSH